MSAADRGTCRIDHIDYDFLPAFCLAQRAFCAAEIAARAFADIFRRFRTGAGESLAVDRVRLNP